MRGAACGDQLAYTFFQAATVSLPISLRTALPVPSVEKRGFALAIHLPGNQQCKDDGQQRETLVHESTAAAAASGVHSMTSPFYAAAA